MLCITSLLLSLSLSLSEQVPHVQKEPDHWLPLINHNLLCTKLLRCLQ
uniref:Uncharacterized protein n=1 Tax=Anguilla anguilla TaxID=7936 RepID=A0A0E9T9I6_ANGAN